MIFSIVGLVRESIKKDREQRDGRGKREEEERKKNEESKAIRFVSTPSAQLPAEGSLPTQSTRRTNRPAIALEFMRGRGFGKRGTPLQTCPTLTPTLLFYRQLHLFANHVSFLLSRLDKG